MSDTLPDDHTQAREWVSRAMSEIQALHNKVAGGGAVTVEDLALARAFLNGITHPVPPEVIRVQVQRMATDFVTQPKAMPVEAGNT